MELWPHQQRALDALRQTVGQGIRRIMLQAPTGSGKTKLAAAVVQGALDKGGRVSFVVPALSLIDQTVEMFWNEGIRNVGVIQASHEMTDWSRPVQVASVQTLQRRCVYPQSNVVIFDEAHVLYEFHKKWLKEPDWQATPIIGLSATPFTKGLGKYFDTLLVAATTRELIEQGKLSKYRVFATGHPDLRDVRTVAGDYHEGDLSDAMNKSGLTADIVSTWQKYWGKDRTLCFGVDRAHAQSLCDRFNAAGIECAYQDADTPESERKEIKRKFHSGEIRIISNIQTLTTGIDYDVRCLILARPTKSPSLYLQIIGRALRTAPDKVEALILDHSNTVQNLGFPDTLTIDSLDNGHERGKVESSEPKPKECPKCGYLKPRRLRKCSNCGHETAGKVNQIYEDDGELMELSGVARKAAKKVFTMEEKAWFLGELKMYAQQKNYKVGWAMNKFRERHNVWPDWSIKDVMPKPVSPATASWLRSRAIAWAKSKRRAEMQQGAGGG